MADVFLAYEIHLSDLEQVAALRSLAQTNSPRNDLNGSLVRLTGLGILPGTIFACPTRASREFEGCPIIAVGDERPANAPFITSPYILPVSSRDRYPINLDDFDRDAGGAFGIPASPPNEDFTWVGYIRYSPSTTPVGPTGTPVPAPQTIRQRRWADGFELPTHGEGSAGGEGSLGQYQIRDASRHPDGLGLRICEPVNSQKRHTVAEFRTGLAPLSSWERLYIRVWTRPPTTAFEFWKAENSGGGTNGASLQLLPSGAIALCDVSNASVRTILGTTAQILTLGVWYKLDMIFKVGHNPGGPGNAVFKLFVNQDLSLDVQGFSASGFGAVGTHPASLVGNEQGLTGGVCLDLDDWICADEPSALSNELPLDFLNGSRVIRINPVAFGPSHNASVWGAGKTAEQLAAVPGVDMETTLDFSSTTADSVLEIGETDIAYQTTTQPRAINAGIVALTIGLLNQRNTGGGDGVLSLDVNGGGYVDKNLVQATSMNWDNAAYFPSGLLVPVPVTDLAMKYTAGSGIQAKIVRAFGASAEMLGVFGAEDLAPDAEVTIPDAPAGIHNAPYERSPWAYAGPPPISPVVIHGRTYVGTGTVLELAFRAPVAFVHIRRVDAAISNGAHWWSSMVAGPIGHEQPASPEGMIYASWGVKDPPPAAGEGQQEGECLLRIVGSKANSNEAGVTYILVAFEDPGMRFCHAGAVHHNRGTIDRTTALFIPAFLAEGAFFHRLSSGGSVNVAAYYKGRGHAASAASPLDAAEVATAVSFSAGGVTSKSGLVPTAGSSGDQETSFMLWRRDDGSGDPGVPNVVKILSYTGDGTASRTLALPDTDKRPMLAYIVPHNGATFFRDPSHTGTTSSIVSTGDALTPNASTGITAGGPGQIYVGSALNANGIVYDVFVIMGGDAACNNGWSCPIEIVPVAPIPSPGWPKPTPLPPGTEPVEPGGPGGPTEPSGPGGGEPPGGEFGPQCISASTKVCNQALGLIGISQPIIDVALDDTPEAQLCRLYYEDACSEALREFPWDFATRYATLVKVAGTEDEPVNGDWTYSYRLPTSALFPRRLINPAIGRKFDPDPPAFRQTGADATGRLLFSNYRDPDSTDEDATVDLEFTYRLNCAATQGDSVFRQALTWLLAHKLAPSISRNKVTAADAWAMYLHTVNRAAAVNARAQQQEPSNGEAEWIRDR